MKKISLFFICFFFISCSKDNDLPANLNSLQELITSSKWAVITEPYISYRIEPNEFSEITYHGRQGDLIKVNGNKIVLTNGQPVIWYLFDNGWIQEKNLLIYTNIYKAKNAIKKMIE